MKTLEKYYPYILCMLFMFTALFLLLAEREGTLNMVKWEQGIMFSYLLLATIFTALGWGILKD